MRTIYGHGSIGKVYKKHHGNSNGYYFMVIRTSIFLGFLQDNMTSEITSLSSLSCYHNVLLVQLGTYFIFNILPTI